MRIASDERIPRDGVPNRHSIEQLACAGQIAAFAVHAEEIVVDEDGGLVAGPDHVGMEKLTEDQRAGIGAASEELFVDRSAEGKRRLRRWQWRWWWVGRKVEKFRVCGRQKARFVEKEEALWFSREHYIA